MCRAVLINLGTSHFAQLNFLEARYSTLSYNFTSSVAVKWSLPRSGGPEVICLIMSESEVNIWSKVDVWVLLLTICPPSCDFVSDMPCGTTRNKTINALLFDLTISDQKYRWLRELFRETNKHPEDWNHPPRLLDQYHFIPVGRLCNSDLTAITCSSVDEGNW